MRIQGGCGEIERTEGGTVGFSDMLKGKLELVEKVVENMAFPLGK